MAGEFEEDGDDIGYDGDYGSDQGTGGLSGKNDNLSGRALNRSVDKQSAEKAKAKPDSWNADVEEAVAQQLNRKGDPTPYRYGYGRFGKQNSQMVEFERLAKQNHTTIPQAMRTYRNAENAWRQHPLLGIEATAQQLGLNTRELAAAYAAQHGLFGDQPQHDISSAAANHNLTASMQGLIDHEASHPKNAYLKSPEFENWAMTAMDNPMPDGRRTIDWMIEKIPDPRQRLAFIAKAYHQDRLQRTMAGRESARQGDMNSANEAQQRIHAGMRARGA